VKIFICNSLQECPIVDLLSRKILNIEGEISGNLFQKVNSIESADAILVPHDAYFIEKHQDYQDYLKYLREISKLKLIIISDRGDFPIKPKIKNMISLRVAFNPGESHRNKILIPYNIIQLADFEYRKYSKIPKVSFIGYVPNLLSPRRFYKSILNSPTHPLLGQGALVRNISILQCQRNLDLFTSTKNKKYFLAEPNRYKRAGDREIYLKNIEQSDIILTPRGDANQSQRFYEAFSAGRVCLIPNTKMFFPHVLMESEVFKKQSLFFNLFTRNLQHEVQKFWDAIGNDRNYLNLQKEAREFYLNFLEFNIFIKNLLQLDISDFKELANY
jgi:hypothetical protein